MRFTQHPLESGSALEHFNKKGLKCHDSSRNYTWDDVLREYTFRGKLDVHHDKQSLLINHCVEVDDSEIDENWVKENNVVARERAAAKTPKGKGKGKAKQSVFLPANRKAVDSSAPEADMGPGNVSLLFELTHTPVADTISEVDNIVDEVVREALHSYDDFWAYLTLNDIARSEGRT